MGLVSLVGIDAPLGRTGHRLGIHGIPGVSHFDGQRVAVGLGIEVGHVVGMVDVVVPRASEHDVGTQGIDALGHAVQVLIGVERLVIVLGHVGRTV